LRLREFFIGLGDFFIKHRVGVRDNACVKVLLKGSVVNRSQSSDDAIKIQQITVFPIRLSAKSIEKPVVNLEESEDVIF